MIQQSWTRRRVLTAVAAVAGLPLAGLAYSRFDGPKPVRWRGVALGADAGLTLYHTDRAHARRTLEACLAEVARLERAFSLYRTDSELLALNRHGMIAAPSHDLVALLAESRRLGQLSGGVFDVTVQPLWRLYSGHFRQDRADPMGPDRNDVARALALVGHEHMDISPNLVRFARSGMAVTLNGIAQGAITDRVSDMLRNEGFERVLVDLGEARALGNGPDGPWRIGLEDPTDTARMGAVVPLADGALATSGGYGSRFDAGGRFHHLFDPALGRSANAVLAATAMAPRATTADALATALAIAPASEAPHLLHGFGGSAARLVLADGSVIHHQA
jgi:thiamine biosynthesis lipoprotein